MSNERTIGSCVCPLCRSDKASVKLSAKNLAYMVCNRCNCQLFARSDVSDGALRSQVTAKAAPEAPATPISTPATAPAQPHTPPEKPAFLLW